MSVLEQEIQDLLNEVQENEVRIQIDERINSVYQYDDDGNIIKYSVEIRNTDDDKDSLSKRISLAAAGAGLEWIEAEYDVIADCDKKKDVAGKPKDSCTIESNI